jgi:hypothetical protein
METPGGGGSGGSRLSYQMPFWVIGALTSSMARVDRPNKGGCRVYVMDFDVLRGWSEKKVAVIVTVTVPEPDLIDGEKRIQSPHSAIR